MTSLRRTHELVPMYAALLLLNACGTADAGEGLATPQVDTLPSGTVTVMNPGPTAWADTNGWRIVEVGRLGGDAAPELLINPNDAAVDGEGRLYVVDNDPRIIKLFDSTGALLRTIGREGEGPGEYRSAVIALHDGMLVVHDPAQSRTSVFDTSGAFVRSWSSACCHFYDVTVDREGRVLVRAPSESRPEYAAAFVRYTMEGDFIDTLWVPKAGEPVYWELTRETGTSRSRFRFGVPFSPGQIVAFTPGGNLVHGWGGDYRIVIGPSATDTARIVSRAARPAAIPEARRREVFDERLGGFIEQFGQSAADQAFNFDAIPETAPAMQSVEVDPAGFLWVSQYTDDTLYAWRDVFDSTGVYLGPVRMPRSSDTEHVLWRGADAVVTARETESGYPELLRYRIVKDVKGASQ